MQREIIADVFETMQILESQSSDKCQFHIEHTILIIRLQYEIAVCVTDGLSHIGDRRGQIGNFQFGFRIGDVRMIETHFGHFDPSTEIKVRTTCIADVIEFGLAVQMLKTPNDINRTYTCEKKFCIAQVQAQLFLRLFQQHALPFFRHDNVFSHNKSIWAQSYYIFLDYTIICIIFINKFVGLRFFLYLCSRKGFERMAVHIEHINKSFGKQLVLQDVTLDIPDGQIVALLGPNGAGKSTLMKILLGLWRANSGHVTVPQRIGYLPENNPLYEEMYVTEYLRFMAKMTQVDNAKVTVEDLIEKVGLNSERHKHIRELSKGYRQRVGLAQALLGDPELLILDEPTTGLDPNQLVEIRTLIRSLGKDKTIILSTHVMQEVREMCDRVIILNHGQVKADEPVGKIDDLEKLFRKATNG